MILVADSGSTKCDWRLITDSDVLETSTIGLNPYFTYLEEIEKELKGNQLLAEHADAVSEVYFYGAGCSSAEMNAIITNGLRLVFPEAEIVVEHDVLGAGVAAGKGRPCIACILGTGSNACFFDGKHISQLTPSLAYVLGDEGSGSWFGKQLLRDFLYGDEMPKELRKHLEEKGIDKDGVLDNVYRKEHPNVYLASFTKDLSQFIETDYVRSMLLNGMREFLKRHVCCYPNHTEVEVNFVGSVAYYFSDTLHEVATELNITIGNIIQKPIDGLVAFHSK